MTQRTFTRSYDPAPKSRNGIEFFYAGLVAWGIVVTVEQGQLVIRAPIGTVSPALRKAIEERKDRLIRHIRSLAT